jgi:hypothetical protein
MTEPRTRFEGEWADGSQAVIYIGQLPTQSGLRVSISARGGWPGLHDAEMLFTPGEAVELADALLMIAAAESDGAAKPMGAKFEADRDPRATCWWIRRPS